MIESASEKYEGPRAVRLADVATGEFACQDGTLGNIDFCSPTGSVPNVNLCQQGSKVQGEF